MAEHEEPRRRAPDGALGARIRAARERAGVPLRELARRLEVSPSLLSQIERGLAQPSVATLWGIVTELELSLDALFARAGTAAAGPAHVQRAGERTAIELEGGVRWEQLGAPADPHAAFAFVTYEPGAAPPPGAPPATHRGREYGYLLSGRLRIEVGDDVLELGAGDAVVLDSEVPHRFRALGDAPAEAVWLNLGYGVGHVQ